MKGVKKRDEATREKDTAEAAARRLISVQTAGTNSAAASQVPDLDLSSLNQVAEGDTPDYGDQPGHGDVEVIPEPAPTTRRVDLTATEGRND